MRNPGWQCRRHSQLGCRLRKCTGEMWEHTSAPFVTDGPPMSSTAAQPGPLQERNLFPGCSTIWHSLSWAAGHLAIRLCWQLQLSMLKADSRYFQLRVNSTSKAAS